MNAISRRGLLVASAAVVPAALLAGCATGPTTPAQVVADAKNAIPALTNALNSVLSVAPNALPAATVTQIKGDLDAAATVLGGLSVGMSATAGASIVKQVEGDLNAVIAAAATVPLIPPPFSIALSAAAVVLPVLEAFAAAYIPAAAASAGVVAARARVVGMAPAMSVSQAEATLAAMAR